jgi:thiazole synthase ThiGH ThiG subunit
MVQKLIMNTLQREYHMVTLQREQHMQLRIYITQHCANCQEALAIAQLARQIVGLEVCVIDLEQSQKAVPDSVVGVPTYLLDESIVSLGNPRREEFLRQLQHKMKESRS